MALIGGGHNFDFNENLHKAIFVGKNSQEVIKYSQSDDIVCQLALLGGKGL